MQLATLAIRGLFFHWRSHLAVLLGVSVGAAVLTGALLIGDSLRGSLRDLTLKRLGRIDCALLSDRFFGDDLEEELRKLPEAEGVIEHGAPAIILRGSVLQRGTNRQLLRRVGRVQVVGVDERFWPLFGEARGDLANGLLLNEPLARELGANVGDYLEIRLERPQAAPSDSIVGRAVDDVGIQIESSPVLEVLTAEGAGQFSLAAQQARPFTVFVALRRLQQRLRGSLQAPGLANALLIAAPPAHQATAADELKGLVASAARLEDLGFRLRPDHSGNRYLSLETRRMLLEPAAVEAVQSAARAAGWQVQPTLTYLANQIRRGDAFVPYSTITALNPSLGPPWGPFPLVNGDQARPLADDEILINSWLADDLWPTGDWQKDVGKPVITISYFVEGEGWLLKEKTATLKLAGVTRLAGPAADRTLTPEFPGLRGTSIRDWEPPFPKEQWHKEWLRPRDDRYWREHRATPKAFVSPALAQKHWKSRHGQYTSLRLAPRSPIMDGTASTLTLAHVPFEIEVRRRLREALPAESFGLRVQPVKAQGLAAAGSSTAEMFGWLFLLFSSFLIVSAMMLVGMLFRLGVERRAREIGVLYAAGYRRSSVRWLLLREAFVVAVLGGVAGIALAVGYAAALLDLLASWWSDSLQTSFLRLHVAVWEPEYLPVPFPSLVLGFALSTLVALGAIALSLRGLSRLSPRALLAGQAAAAPGRTSAQVSWSWITTSAATLLTAGTLVAGSFYVRPDVAAPLFFGGGACLLAGLLSLVMLWLRLRRGALVRGHGPAALVRLGAGNAARHPGRSLLTIGLLASATFLVVAVESFRKSAGADAQSRSGGTGGFALVAEADVPLFQVPSTEPARRELLPEANPLIHNTLEAALYDGEVFGLRVRPGDDVSCLNLYQPQQPRILGVPPALSARGGFAFSALDAPSAEEQKNPWRLLERNLADGRVPILADDHTAQWILHKAPGDEWTITDERGVQVTLRLVGLLHGSIFQSELLMAEEHFRRLFPSRQGYAFFLIKLRTPDSNHAQRVLEFAFGEHFGLTVVPCAARLAAFEAVENTYLSTFQLLGGMGVLLGTLGLAVVLLRNVGERRGELALLRALGFGRRSLGWLVLAENALLVLVGLAVGLLAALVAVAPHLRDRLGDIPWLGVAALVGLTVLFGLGSGIVALLTTLRTPLLPALRRE